MQENSCIAFSYVLSWPISPSIHVWSLDKHNVNFKGFSICFNVDEKPWGKTGALRLRNQRNSQNHASLLDVDPLLMLEVFALDTNETNIKLDKVSVF